MRRFYRATLLFALLFVVSNSSVRPSAFTPRPQSSPPIGLITVEELKAKLASNTPLTIIDVRAASGFADSTGKIRGAIHVKLRKLRYRLGFPPLNNVPRDREAVTYCACPTEESSIQAARILLDNGFKNVRALKGGWQEWLRVNGQIEAKPKGM